MSFLLIIYNLLLKHFCRYFGPLYLEFFVYEKSFHIPSGYLPLKIIQKRLKYWMETGKPVPYKDKTQHTETFFLYQKFGQHRLFTDQCPEKNTDSMMTTICLTILSWWDFWTQKKPGSQSQLLKNNHLGVQYEIIGKAAVLIQTT